MAVSKRLRYEILRRDDHQCRYCGGSAPDVVLTVDHVVPTTLGGSDAPENLVTACRDCNAGKSASSPDSELVADVDQRAAQWGHAMAVAVERRAAELAIARDATAWFDDAWTTWKRGDETIPRDPSWKNSVLRFLAGGLDRETITDAIATAMGKERLPDRDRWRYFCGICWRELDTIRDMTAAVLAETEAQPQPQEDHPRFEYMTMFAEFLDALVPAVGGTDEVRQAVGRSFKDAVKAAYSEWVWTQTPDDGGAATESARKLMRDVIAHDMEEITLWFDAHGGRCGS